jgi:hypothetical protein
MPSMTWTFVDLIASVGAPIDFEAFDEIQSNVNLLNASVGVGGEDVFAGTGASTQITFAVAQADANYRPVITALAATGGDLGEVYVSDRQTTGFKIHNTGAFTGALAWQIFRS